MSHEGGTKYKEGEGGFEPVTYRSQHNINQVYITKELSLAIKHE